MALQNILDDKREIESAWSAPPDEVGATVGYEGVTKIDVYEECTDTDCHIWLRAWRGDTIWKRLRANAMAEIRYKDE